MLKLIYFAAAREAVGRSEEQIEFHNQTVQDVWKWISETYPNMPKDSIRLAVNEEYALMDEALQDGDVVALIPPVSGG